MTILNPRQSESRTIWHVTNEHDSIVATLEIGQRYRHALGMQYRLCGVMAQRGYVMVERNGVNYCWHVSSLIPGPQCTGLKLLAEQLTESQQAEYLIAN